MMRLRIILFIVFYVLTSQAYATSQKCGYNCLAEGDKQALQTFRSNFSYLLPTFQSCQKAIKQIAPGDFSNSAYEHKRFAKVCYQVANLSKEAYNKTKNPDLKTYYAVIGNNFGELADLLTAGAAICDAKSRNSTEFATGALEALVTGEAKSLVAPIVSKYDLNNRIIKFADLFERRYPAIFQTIEMASKKLYDKTGIAP